jgi:hypothetical protein
LGLAAAFGVIEQLPRAASDALTLWATTASMSSESDMSVPHCKTTQLTKLQSCVEQMFAAILSLAWRDWLVIYY